MKHPLVILAFVATLFAAPVSQATIITFDATLSGASESPANPSPGTGTAKVIFDDVANTMEVVVSFVDLIGATTASHIHCCTTIPGSGTAAVATQLPNFTGFPLGVTSGTYDQTFNMSFASSYSPSFVTAHGGTVSSAEAALLAGMEAGDAYFNIHTRVFPGGEIRGFLQREVPEPGTLALLGLGLAGLCLGRRKQA